MNTHVSPRRGQALLDADRAYRSGGLTARLLAWAPASVFHRQMDAIDAGLLTGSLEVHLPDGSVRLLGGRGEGLHATIEIKNWTALIRLALSGSVGWYRAWDKGEWSSPDLVPIFALFMQNAASLGQAARSRGPWWMLNRAMHRLNRNSRRGSRRNIHAHYDLGNDFYRLWLDEGMNYSSALFDGDALSLEQAQEQKIDAILNRLALHSGSRLLEIGCGWGGLAHRAVERHDVLYTGITLSPSQAEWARGRLDAGSHVEICDYRDATGQYDAIASVEMIEAVGQNYWPTYLETLARLLRPGGRAAIQFILINDELFDAYAASTDFIQAYIFPGGCLMSESRFRALAEAQGLGWQDIHYFGDDYAETLLQWRARFDAAVQDKRLPHGFDDRFVRLWRFYLQYCEGGFRGQGINVAQVTLIKQG